MALLLPAGGRAADGHPSFDVAIYDRAYEVWEMADLEWLRTREGDALRLRLHHVVAK